MFPQMFHSAHYAGEPLVPKFGPDEPWKKVFGPVFIYVNSVFGDGDPFWLWEDAKEQVQQKKTNRFLLHNTTVLQLFRGFVDFH